MLKNYSMNVLYIRVISLDVSAGNISPRPAKYFFEVKFLPRSIHKKAMG